MVFKINIADKSGKTYKLELESEELPGKELHSAVSGKELLPALEGYEFEITGASDSSGFTAHKDVPGIGLKRLLLTYGKAMHGRPRKEGKKPRSAPTPRGLRLRKTARGRVIAPDIVQINLKVTKHGHKPLAEIFPEQNKKTRPSVAELEQNKAKEEAKEEEKTG